MIKLRKEQVRKEVLNAEIHKSKGLKICDNCRCTIKDGEDYALTGEYNNQIKLCRNCYKVIPLKENDQP